MIFLAEDLAVYSRYLPMRRTIDLLLFFELKIRFLPRNAMLARYAVVICLSVFLSVTRRYCIKMAAFHIFVVVGKRRDFKFGVQADHN